MCASETILTPAQSTKIGLDAGRIKDELLKFQLIRDKRDNKDLSSSNSDGNGEDNSSSNSTYDNNNINNNNNGPIRGSSQNTAIDIVPLQEKDLYIRIFKIGFGQGTSNPVTDSTTFFRPNKDQHQVGQDVTYTSGIVQSSKQEEGGRMISFLSSILKHADIVSLSFSL